LTWKRLEDFTFFAHFLDFAFLLQFQEVFADALLNGSTSVRILAVVFSAKLCITVLEMELLGRNSPFFGFSQTSTAIHFFGSGHNLSQH